jgi:membrane protein implicated in regulation of membrane protease activity
MFSKYLSLDEFLTPGLIKPFYLLALGLTALGTLFGVLSGLSSMIYSPIAGLIGVLISLLAGIAYAIAIRFFSELFIAVFRLHDRFVGGQPKDGLPE